MTMKRLEPTKSAKKMKKKKTAAQVAVEASTEMLGITPKPKPEKAKPPKPAKPPEAPVAKAKSEETPEKPRVIHEAVYRRMLVQIFDKRHRLHALIGELEQEGIMPKRVLQLLQGAHELTEWAENTLLAATVAAHPDFEIPYECLPIADGQKVVHE